MPHPLSIPASLECVRLSELLTVYLELTSVHAAIFRILRPFHGLNLFTFSSCVIFSRNKSIWPPLGEVTSVRILVAQLEAIT